MSNPYSPPVSPLESKKAVSTALNGKRLALIAKLVSILTILVLALLACVMIVQAIQLASTNVPAPPGRPNLDQSTIRASWMLGLTAIGGMVANIIGLVLIRKQKVGIAFALCGASILSLICFAIAFKPA